MRTCKKCFDYLYVFVNGDVRFWPWNGKVIGNLKKNTLEEIWNGKEADEIRRAFLEGNLLYCSEQYCPECINNTEALQVSKEEMESLYNNLPKMPKTISLSYDERCNHACPSCRQCFLKPDAKYLEDLKTITSNIEPYISEVKYLSANGIGDLFVSHEMLGMLSRFRPKNDDFMMHIETNGVLFKANWEKIKHFGDYHLTVSVTPSSYDRETYKYLAGVDDLERFEESLRFITELKHQGKVNRIRIIMVIQDSNFRQIPEFIKKSIEVYDADEVILRPIFEWFGLKEDELLYKNVLNPCHPYHKEYEEIIKDPILSDPRVFNWAYNVPQKSIEFPTLAMKREYEKLTGGCGCGCTPLKQTKNTVLQNIFSVRNDARNHKVLTVLGIKVKVKK